MPHETELFLDDNMIEMAASVVRKMHRPSKHPLNPVVHSEKWWEGNINIPYATLYDEDEKCFKMWLRSGWDGTGQMDKAEGHTAYTTYLTSKDGVHWEKPEIGIMEFCGRRDHNVIYVGEINEEFSKFKPQGRKGFIMSVARHPNPKNENQKYVGVSYKVGKLRGAYLGYSPDGIRWQFDDEPFWRTPTDCATWGDDHFVILNYDKVEKKWILWRRVIPEESERMIGNAGDRDWKPVDRYFRVWARAESSDLKELKNCRMILSTDANDPPDTEAYNLSCYKYENVYVGYLNVYHMRPGSWHLDVQLVTSRNGLDFTRVCRREPFIPSGTQGYYNNGWIDYDVRLGCQAEPLIVDDTVYVYYHGFNRNHGKGNKQGCDRFEGGCAGLVTFKRDRFVSLETGLPGPCKLVTKPFVVKYPKLFLNAATWQDGTIHAELLTRDWNVIPGFSEAQSTAIKGNALSHPVRWEGNADLGGLVGREVRLRFCMKNAGIHAMTFSTEDLELRKVADRDPDEAAWKPSFNLVGEI